MQPISAPTLKNPPSIQPSAAKTQMDLLCRLLGADGSGVWMRGAQADTLRLAWTQSLTDAIPEKSEKWDSFKEMPYEGYVKKAPFLASQPGMTEGRAFLFIPIGNLPEGVAVFAGPTNLWNQFQSARDTVLSALSLIREAVPTTHTDPTGIAQLASALFGSRSPEEAAAASADFYAKDWGLRGLPFFTFSKNTKTPSLLRRTSDRCSQPDGERSCKKWPFS